jgi:hypothetical protein
MGGQQHAIHPQPARRSDGALNAAPVIVLARSRLEGPFLRPGYQPCIHGIPMGIIKKQEVTVRKSEEKNSNVAGTCAKVANSKPERCRRRGKTRQVMKNQLSDSIRRRSRDMRVIIILGSNPAIQNLRSPPSRAPEERKKRCLRAHSY